MDWNDNEEQAAFRNEVKTFLQEKLPDRYKNGGDDDEFEGGWQADRLSDNAEVAASAKAWSDALASKGWIAPHWPKEYGGASLSPMEQFIYNMEMAESGAPRVGGSGVGMLGPTLIVHGTEEQKAQHLGGILSGEVVWAQGYSEPGAGSDLASLQTRAIRDGDEYVVNGQKIWTSGAHHADWLFMLARTDPDAPKHRGISFLLTPKSAPGISVRPLINMAWSHGFNETFFEDVHIPVSNRVGEENRGWYVGMTLLDYERSNITGAVSARKDIDELIGYASGEGKSRSRLDSFNSLRLDVADRFIETEVMYNFSFRIISMQARGLIPNYEASTSKLYNSELVQRLSNTGMKVFGLYSNVWDKKSGYSPVKSKFTQRYVSSVSATIAAGSSEIQRNIIATRGLGLPRG
ncbi:MAG: acyl-CoA dehydrogenase family protein [Dehalococcoidia bacterium]|nr:acyl-CoA dehydrogenase family protein [Dehalococcoidia bacterium]MCB9483171.1 acyl-CoA dehydrogenase family protein [Dehalococcoidia bacterium]